jgi:hypothetical protein
MALDASTAIGISWVDTIINIHEAQPGLQLSSPTQLNAYIMSCAGQLMS